MTEQVPELSSSGPCYQASLPVLESFSLTSGLTLLYKVLPDWGSGDETLGPRVVNLGLWSCSETMTTTSLPVFVLLLLPQLPSFCWASSYLSRLHFPAPPLQRGVAKWLFWPMGCERKREGATSVSCPILHSFPIGWEGDSDIVTSHHKVETTYWRYVWTIPTCDKKQNSVFVYTPLCVGPPCYSNCDGTLT